MTSAFYPYQYNIFQRPRDQLQQWLTSVPDQATVIFWSLEYVPEKDLAEYLDIVRCSGRSGKVAWVIQPSHDYSQPMMSALGDRVIRIDNDKLMHYFYLYHDRCCEINQNWNPHTGRFLFLLGKPNRYNRLPLLYLFDQKKLLDCCDWSLYIPDDVTMESCRAIMPELDHDVFDEFVQRAARKLDPVLVKKNNNSRDIHISGSGYPFDPNTYGQTSFRVISETHSTGSVLVTEKTWITIANHHPFIMAGHSGTLDWLKSKGYRTFEKYLPYPDYDSIIDDRARMEAVASNASYWATHIHLHEQDIAQDVIHNARLLEQEIEESCHQAQQLHALTGDQEIPWQRLVPWFSIDQYQWMLFYYRVRDPSWPECYSPEAFERLPIHIQEECKTQFGYDPTKSFLQ